MQDKMEIGNMFDVTIKPEKITTSPKLIEYLKTHDWKIQDGHPKQKIMKKQFQEMLCQHPEKIRFRFNEITQQVKLMTKKDQPNLWEIVILRLPHYNQNKILAKIQKIRYAPTSLTETAERSDCSGSLKNYVSSDDILTEFEIAETTKMVRKWIRNKVYLPSNARALILLDSSSDSDSTTGNQEKVMRSFRRNKPKKKTQPPSPLATPLTPSPPRIRPTRTIGKYDLFCDDTETDTESDTKAIAL